MGTSSSYWFCNVTVLSPFDLKTPNTSRALRIFFIISISSSVGSITSVDLRDKNRARRTSISWLFVLRDKMKRSVSFPACEQMISIIVYLILVIVSLSRKFMLSSISELTE